MTRYLLQRLLGTIPVLLLVTFLVYGLLHLAPGDPASLLLPEDATPEDVAEMRRRWGLDQPFVVQYVYFVANAVQGNLGRSFRFAQPVTELIATRLPATIELATFAILIAFAIALPLGVLAGARPDSPIDNLGTTVGLFGISMPNFWFGIMLILLFAGTFHLLPSAGRSTYGIAGDPITGFYLLDSVLTGNWPGLADGLRHLLLPAVTLGTALAGIQMRITRSAVLETSREDYVLTARAKGLQPWSIVWRHGLRNALLPVITLVALSLGLIIGGSITIEYVFSYPGIGLATVEAIDQRDYPLLQAIFLFLMLAVIFCNLVADLLYFKLDPRVTS
jgi:peptide/nickel transport system permease protein